MLQEKNEQILFVQYCKLKGIKVVAIPNGFWAGRMRNKFAYINSMKKQGMSVGFPDLIVFAKNKTYNMLFLEFKREKRGKVSDEQAMWQEWLNNNGYFARVVKGNKEAVEVLENYLNNNNIS